MSESLIVTRVDFDGMENHIGAAVSKKNVAVFTDGENGTAFKQAAGWFSAQEPLKLYLGWNHQVYPRFAIERISHE